MEDVIEETQKVLTDSMSGAGKALSDEKIKTLKQRLKVYRKERDQAKKVSSQLQSYLSNAISRYLLWAMIL
jgi:adenylate kinase family enzyme